MLFNPSDKSNSIIAHTDFLLFGDGSTFNSEYSLVDRTRNVNITLDEIITELFKADPNFMWDDVTNEDFPIATTDLESGEDHVTLPDSSLVIHRMRIKNQEGKWITLTPRLRREFSDTDLASTGTPDSYYKIDNAVFPIPVPNYGVTGGVELEFQRGANHFASTDTNVSPGFNSQFHHVLAIGAAQLYAMANGMQKKVTMLFQMRDMANKKILEHYQRRSPDERPKLRLARRSIKNYGL